MDNNKELKEMKCEPCSEGAPKMTQAEIAEYKSQVPDWDIVKKDGVRRLERSFEFDDFKEALDFTERVGQAAEAEDHHPTLVTKWGEVTVNWWTTKIDDLHKNDFIMAAKTDELYH